MPFKELGRRMGLGWREPGCCKAHVISQETKKKGRVRLKQPCGVKGAGRGNTGVYVEVCVCLVKYISNYLDL